MKLLQQSLQLGVRWVTLVDHNMKLILQDHNMKLILKEAGGKRERFTADARKMVLAE